MLMELLLSSCVFVSLVMSLAICLCWRKKTPNNEWQGLDGMVTQKNPDENVNHLPSAAAPCVLDNVNASGDSNDSSRRNVVSNTRRSLPDIPSEQGAVNWEPTGDNSSEHYATVGQYQNSVKRHTIPNGIEARPSVSQHSSISQADDAFSPYERVKYDKIKSKEHPYAQLQPTTSRSVVYEENNTAEERVNLLRVDSSNEPNVPPRSRRSSAHSGLGVDIPAASAVAGGIAASPELPYMTPPVTQANFSGDSQDSSKGYTSISVREPLANIIAQTKGMHKKRELDPHYSTVSDDSDDVYTTIPDANNPIYTSESETYARIPAMPLTVEVEVNPIPADAEDEIDEGVDQLYEPAPQPPPPSVDSLKHVTAHSHSRQASSSSSIANLGSPKPEKRQANSPLPPPPTANSFDFHVDKVQAFKNLDDLYAKVHKTKKEDIPTEKTPDKSSKFVELGTRNSIACTSFGDETRMERIAKEHNYETLKKSPRKLSDPGYEKIKNEEPGYASINGPDSLTSSDPGYEVLKQRAPSESDPNYEELRHRVSNASDCGYSRIKENASDAGGYSVVNKKRTETPVDEPNYESMPSDSHYAAIKSNGSESDPNYESVSERDPNYESVLDEPPYERLDDDSSRTDSDLIPGYERVRKKYEANDTSESSNSAGGKSSSDKSEPPYEQLSNDTDSEVPGYERINSIVEKKFTKSETSNSSNSILEDNTIFQV